MNRLAIVIITRNEARNVRRCVESALATAERVPDTTVLLVDSASSDATCALALPYPISIVQLRSDWRLTPAAGRFIGTGRTESEYILFVDGDMALCPDWLEAGLAFMDANPQAAALSGELDEVYYGENGNTVGVRPRRYGAKELSTARALGGVGLYRRSALDQVGTFNPFIPLREEAELALRLRRAGNRLYRNPQRIAVHYSAPRDTLKELKRRYRAGYYAGFGRAIFYSFRNGVGWPFLREQAMPYILFAAFLWFGLLCAFLMLVTGYWQPLAFWVGLTGVGVAANATGKHSVKQALLGFLVRGLMIYGAIVGMLSAVFDPPEYPTNVIVVKEPEMTAAGISFDHPTDEMSHESTSIAS